MAEFDTSKITLTLKADGAPWAVLRADSPEEADELLTAFENGLQERLIQAAVSFRAAGSHLAPPRGSRPAGNGGGQPQQSAPAPSGGTVAVKVAFADAALRDQVKAAGGKWDGTNKVWNVPAGNAEQFRAHWANAA